MIRAPPKAFDLISDSWAEGLKARRSACLYEVIVDIVTAMSCCAALSYARASGSPGDAALGDLVGQLALPAQHRQQSLEQKAQHQDLQRQIQRVFHGAGGHVV